MGVWVGFAPELLCCPALAPGLELRLVLLPAQLEGAVPGPGCVGTGGLGRAATRVL